jgi:hypothetical protein
VLDSNIDIYFGYIPGYKWILQDISRSLVWITFLGYIHLSYPASQKISCYILQYPCISFHRQTISFIEISIEAGILLGGKHEAYFVLGVAGIESMPS